MNRGEEEFQSLNPGRVLMYTCGPTVYHFTHIGNMRSFLTADILRRVLEFNGYVVTHVKNITDVGHLRDEALEMGADRIEAAAREQGKTPVEIADFYTRRYLRDEAEVNLVEPEHRPRATQYIPEMIELAQRLVVKGYAYAVGGNVYFDISTFPSYGALSGNRLEDLVAGQRIEVEPHKRHSADFALWKHGDPGRFMNWESPWGIGFPGWHIECSAMASELLGDQIDIHTGGIDNLFPHHEDERAQSEAATGNQFVRYWVHTAHLLSGDEKMSRSLGNYATVSDLSEQGISPLAFRYFLLQAHYRKKLTWTKDALQGAQVGVDRIWNQVAELLQEPQGNVEPESEQIRSRFVTAINDDLGVPQALAILQELLDRPLSAATKLDVIADMDRVFGLNLVGTGRHRTELTSEQQHLIEQRTEARIKQNWDLSDNLRIQLQDLGVEVRDTPRGQRWVRLPESSGWSRPTSGNKKPAKRP